MFLNELQNADFTMFFLQICLVLTMTDREIVWDEELPDVLCKAADRRKHDLKYLIVRLADDLKIKLPGRTAR